MDLGPRNTVSVLHLSQDTTFKPAQPGLTRINTEGTTHRAVGLGGQM